MKHSLPCLLASAFLLSGCGKTGNETRDQTNPSKGAGNPLTAPVDYLGAVGAAQKRSVKVADLVPVQQAVQAFQAGEDRLPANLQEIVTEGYLPRLPDLPKGARFEYNPRSGQVRIIDPPVAPATALPGKK